MPPWHQVAHSTALLSGIISLCSFVYIQCDTSSTLPAFILHNSLHSNHRYRQEISDADAIFIPAGLQLRVIGFFLMINISMIYQVCYHLYLLQFEHEDKHEWKKSHCISFAIVFMCLVGKDPNTPNWLSMADNAITWGSMGGLGSPFYICDSNSLVLHLNFIPFWEWMWRC